MTSIKYSGFPGLTTWEAFDKKDLYEQGERKRFPTTYKLLMSLRVKHASSFGGFRFFLFTSPIHSQFCSHPSSSISFHCDTFMFIPGLIYASFLQEDEDVFFASIKEILYVFIYFTSSLGNFQEKRSFTDTACTSQILSKNIK